ncbi:hypothetical protein [Lentibacillus cibarius]|uniref:Uncharacterized protein n=1 Tax=Lentibacillus cibarius TaxID=2583219 RepID=A0A5S3QJ79_9BACI|nr:hypothetical protein [Lentibacillus cibarius]TMN21779.1 hypothetical protein FFL34_06390 [Lentibacillus cibarius]
MMVGVGVALAVGSGLYTYDFSETEEEEESPLQREAQLPDEHETWNMAITTETEHEIAFVETTEQDYVDRIHDVTYTYEIGTDPVSNFNVTKRTVDNGDQFLFTTLENKSDEDLEVSVTVPIADTSYYSLQSFSQYKTGPRISEDIKADLTTSPLGLVTTYKGDEFHSNLMVGKKYQSKDITKTYENGQKSKLRKLLSENQDLDIDVKLDGMTLQMDMDSDGKDIIDHWLLYSDERLFSSNESYQDWIRKYNVKKYKNNNWYTAKGPYKKVVRTAEPTPESELQYGRNLLIVREDEVLKRYKETEERYHYDLLLNSVANLEIFKGDKAFWETEYTNGWLNRVYDMKAPYVDTRHNEGVALFLEETGEILGIPEIKDALTNYADLLVNQMETGQVIEVGDDAYLISDYFKYGEDAPITHSSLNHVIGGMNLLLETYNSTGNEKYLDTAKKIQNGINELGEQWLTDEGDTWYQINPDHTFQGEDYTNLTLTDMLKAVELWKKIDASQTDTLEMLIESKANYLNRNDITLSPEAKELLR